MKGIVEENEGALVYGANFSVGVQIFYRIATAAERTAIAAERTADAVEDQQELEVAEIED